MNTTETYDWKQVKDLKTMGNNVDVYMDNTGCGWIIGSITPIDQKGKLWHFITITSFYVYKTSRCYLRLKYKINHKRYLINT